VITFPSNGYFNLNGASCSGATTYFNAPGPSCTTSSVVTSGGVSPVFSNVVTITNLKTSYNWYIFNINNIVTPLAALTTGKDAIANINCQASFTNTIT
jgi:hypothetical protein